MEIDLKIVRDRDEIVEELKRYSRENELWKEIVLEIEEERDKILKEKANIIEKGILQMLKFNIPIADIMESFNVSEREVLKLKNKNAIIIVDDISINGVVFNELIICRMQIKVSKTIISGEKESVESYILEMLKMNVPVELVATVFNVSEAEVLKLKNK
jgi:hypothetical protein